MKKSQIDNISGYAIKILAVLIVFTLYLPLAQMALKQELEPEMLLLGILLALAA